MSTAQWTVAGLLLLLLGLEVLRVPALKAWFVGLFAQFNLALNNASQGATKK